jgi:hypothetical protein
MADLCRGAGCRTRFAELSGCLVKKKPKDEGAESAPWPTLICWDRLNCAIADQFGEESGKCDEIATKLRSSSDSGPFSATCASPLAKIIAYYVVLAHFSGFFGLAAWRGLKWGLVCGVYKRSDFFTYSEQS